jgi:hypothetical protein
MYAWQQPYFEAVLEPDDARMSHHLLEALASMEQRLLSPTDRNSDEFHVLQNTWCNVQEILQQRRTHNVGSRSSEVCSFPLD